jgi:hypothetical protein
LEKLLLPVEIVLAIGEPVTKGPGRAVGCRPARG